MTVNSTTIELLDLQPNKQAENLINHLRPFTTVTGQKGRTVFYYVRTADNRLIATGRLKNPQVLSEVSISSKDNTQFFHMVTVCDRKKTEYYNYSVSFNLESIQIQHETEMTNIYFVRFFCDGLIYELEIN